MDTNEKCDQLTGNLSKGGNEHIPGQKKPVRGNSKGGVGLNWSSHTAPFGNSTWYGLRPGYPGVVLHGNVAGRQLLHDKNKFTASPMRTL